MNKDEYVNYYVEKVRRARPLEPHQEIRLREVLAQGYEYGIDTIMMFGYTERLVALLSDFSPRIIYGRGSGKSRNNKGGHRE